MMKPSHSLDVQIPFVDISTYTPDEKAMQCISESMATRLCVLPLFQVKTMLVVATTQPSDFMMLNELKRETKLDIFPVMSSENELKTAIANYYKNIDTLQAELNILENELKQSVFFDLGTEKVRSQITIQDTETPVSKLVNKILEQAVKISASDVHIEPNDDHVKLRYRIDGLLQELAQLPLSVYAGVVSRIKIMSGLDIAENRLPQDGRAKIIMLDKTIDVRVSTFPTLSGENVVIRVLDQSVIGFTLEQLGLSPSLMPRATEQFHNPYGIFLVAGPTGSGKTTTLYSILNQINSIHKNIITIEDPVEYSLSLVRQSQINLKIGLTFSTGLRSILRQDPDVILVGEIRDLPTTEIAIQAALTGHLVFSTIHTNDAASTISRLIDIGAEPFLLSSSINGVLAQRLVRRICPQCKEEYAPDSMVLSALSLAERGLHYFRGKGCIHCRHTGYRGRLGIFELMIIEEKIRHHIVQRSHSSAIQHIAIENGMIPLFEDGVQKMNEGVTTLEEVLRVTRGHP